MRWDFAQFFGQRLHGQSCGTWSCPSSITSGFPTLYTYCDFCAAPFHLDLWISYSSGICLHLGFVTVVSEVCMQRPRFRPLQPYRFLHAGSPACSFILAGGGVAVDLQFQIFSFLYTPDSANLDLVALGRSASALQLVT